MTLELETKRRGMGGDSVLLLSAKDGHESVA